MFEINFLSMFERDANAADRLRAIVARTDAMAGDSKRAATAFLMDEVGLITDSTRNEAWYELALNYSLALAHIFLDEPEQAAPRMARSGVLPGGGGAFVFSEAVSRGLSLAAAQEDAMARHAPTVILSSMPRAASAALATTLGDLLGAPAMRASAGRFPDHYLMPCWLERLARGGAILHDHFGAGPFNLSQIRGGALGTVFVLLRDPRAAAVSFNFLRYEDLIGNIGGGDDEMQLESIQRILRHFGHQRADIEVRDAILAAWGVSETFDRGQLNAWRDAYDARTTKLFAQRWGSIAEAWGYSA